MTMLTLLLIPLTAKQPNAIIPIFTKPNHLALIFLKFFYMGGMQYAIAVAVTKVAHSNIQL